jgi:hypothetical protein
MGRTGVLMPVKIANDDGATIASLTIEQDLKGSQ